MAIFELSFLHILFIYYLKRKAAVWYESPETGKKPW